MGAIGFVGLGIMGQSMAINLVRGGHDVTVWNRTASRTEPVAAEGGVVAGSARQVAESCDIVMVCVSDTPDVEAVVFGPDGIAEGVRAGSLIVDHSTISASATKGFAERIRELGGSWLDAPVSGGAEGARNATLSIMIGGDEADVARALPYLESVGKTITHVGAQGAGQLAKAVNQVLVVVNQLAVSEALLLAQAGDLDLETTLRAVEQGAAGSWMLSNRGPQMIERDWNPGFTIDLQQKDLRLVLDTADDLGVPLPGTALVFQLYRALQKRGLGAEGNHALVKALEELSGIEIGSHD